MRFFVDRIEDGRCFIESESGEASAVLGYIPENAAEGDCLVMTENGFAPDPEYTKKRRDKISALKQRLIGKER